MKKFATMTIAVFLAFMMLTACAGKGPGSDATPPKNDATPVPISTSKPTPTPTFPPAPKPTPSLTPISTSTPALTPTQMPTPTPTPTPTPGPSEKAAFAGTTEEILKLLISKTIERKAVSDEEPKRLKSYFKAMETESGQDNPGHTTTQFAVECASMFLQIRNHLGSFGYVRLRVQISHGLGLGVSACFSCSWK